LAKKMLIGTATGPDIKSLNMQIEHFIPLVDLIELRMDLIDIDENVLTQAMETVSKPCILKIDQKDYEKRPFFYKRLLECGFSYVDIEYPDSKSLVFYVRENYPNMKVILSYHNFERADFDIESLFEKMKAFHADYYKIVAKARSATESLKLLDFLRWHNDFPLICFAMGEYGVFTRVIAKIFNSSMTYAAFDDQMRVDQQICAVDYHRIYRFKKLNQKTKIYGLLGNPISQSIGHLFHNGVFEKENHNAVYVKILLKEEELSEFLKESIYFPFEGFSITYPFKKEASSFFNSKSYEKIGVNTLKKDKDSYLAGNTDGIGALKALSKHLDVKDKKVCVLGTGSTACSIAQVLKPLTKKIYFISRSPSNKGDLSYTDLKEVDYDLLINATPIPLQNLCLQIDPKAHVLDVVMSSKKDLNHPFWIEGSEMFIMQAKEQQDIWFSKKLIKK